MFQQQFPRSTGSFPEFKAGAFAEGVDVLGPYIHTYNM